MFSVRQEINDIIADSVSDNRHRAFLLMDKSASGFIHKIGERCREKV